MKHFVLTILQFYFSFNLKLPSLISVLPRFVLKMCRRCLRVTWLGKLHFFYDGDV